MNVICNLKIVDQRLIGLWKIISKTKEFIEWYYLSIQSKLLELVHSATNWGIIVGPQVENTTTEVKSSKSIKDKPVQKYTPHISNFFG